MQKEIAESENSTKELAREEERLQQKYFATPQEIESGKLPPEEILSLPMFKVSEVVLILMSLLAIAICFGKFL